jgi:hypothetical protein
MPQWAAPVSGGCFFASHANIRASEPLSSPLWSPLSSVRQTLIPLILCVVTATVADAGHVIHGHVSDAASDEPLAAATVQVVDTYRGTIANDSGDYVLELNQLPATVRITYVGYATQERLIADSSVAVVDIALEPVPYEMPAMIVFPEDLAVRIMREVIRRKQEWMPRIESYKAEAYSRRVLEKVDEIAMMEEVVSEIYWDRDKGRREVVLSQHGTDNMEEQEYTSSLEGFVNLYEDDIPFIGHRVIGLTHPDALDHYHFEVTAQRYLDKTVVYDISVEPRSRLQAAFVGSLSVLDGEFALLQVDLRPSKSTLTSAVPIPIIDIPEFSFQQQFRRFADGVWLPVDYRASLQLKIGMIGLSFPLMRFSILTRLTDYEVNVDVPDSIYAGDKLQIDSLSVQQDSFLATYVERIPLTSREVDAYETLDSTMTLEETFRPSGFLARFVDIDEGQQDRDNHAEAERTESAQAGGDTLPPPAALARRWRKLRSTTTFKIRYNRVDAAHLSLETTHRLPHSLLDLHLRGGYSSGPERWSFGGAVERRWREGEVGAQLEYGRDMRQRYHSDTYNLTTNSLQFLLGLDDYFDYYRSDFWRGELEYRPNRWNNLYLSLAFRHQDDLSVSRNTSFALLNLDRPNRGNTPIHQGRLRSLALILQKGNDYIPYGVAANRRVKVEIEHSADWIQSEFSFTRYQLTLDWHQKTFWQRRVSPNALDVRLTAGTSTGSLPVQRAGILDVSVGPLSPFGTFRSTHNRPYEGDSYLGLFWEHNFKTVPFEFLGLWGLARRGVGLVIFGAHGRTWIDDDWRQIDGYSPRDMRSFHHELGASLLLYHLFRVDVTRRLDRSGWSAGVGIARFDFDAFGE